MNRSREALDELIERVLEGDATPAELLEFEAELARDPAARVRFESRSDVFRRLSQLQPSEVPPGLHDAVMSEVLRSPRSRMVAAPVLSSGPSRWPRWADRRWAFPAVAVVVACGLLWFAGGRPRPGSSGRSEQSGTLVGTSGAGALTLGEGDAALQVRWERARTGFVLRLDPGAERVEVDVAALTPGTGFVTEHAAGGQPAPPALHLRLTAHQRETLLGSAPTPNARIRIQVKFTDGQAVEREFTITGLQDAAPKLPKSKTENASEEPTSALPGGH